jgi:hypothetical protein
MGNWMLSTIPIPGELWLLPITASRAEMLLLEELRNLPKMMPRSKQPALARPAEYPLGELSEFYALRRLGNHAFTRSQEAHACRR